MIKYCTVGPCAEIDKNHNQLYFIVKTQESMSEQEHYQQSLVIMRHMRCIVLSWWLLQRDEELTVKEKPFIM